MLSIVLMVLIIHTESLPYRLLIMSSNAAITILNPDQLNHEANRADSNQTNDMIKNSKIEILIYLNIFGTHFAGLTMAGPNQNQNCQIE